MRAAFLPALALLLSAAEPLRAEESATQVSGEVGFPSDRLATADLFDSAAFASQMSAVDSAAPALSDRAYPQHRGDEAFYPAPRRTRDAREGLLLSFGLGGGSTYLSSQGAGRTGAFDLDFRLGYGFSDRFQLFMDFGVDAGRYPQSADFASWTFTIRGQTVLFGDRAGNGLNLNLGIGVGGVDYTDGYYATYSTSSGLALAGGISYDARVTPWFSLSPEFFVNWHEIPNNPGFASDVSSTYGLRLNFLWYLK